MASSAPSSSTRFHERFAAGAGRGQSGDPLVRLVTLMRLRTPLRVAARFGPQGVDERVLAQDP